MRARLTDKLIQNLKGERYVPHRAGIRSCPRRSVSRCGKRRKTFVVMTGKQRKRSTIGHYPQMSLQDARRRARHLLLATVIVTTL